MAVLLFPLGLLLLVVGAEALVRGASRLASAVGISPLVIGLTVVAYGTSAPELVVSVTAGLAGQTDIALGNVVGSNIFNVLFILGLSALIAPLVVSQQLVRLDVPLMIAVSLLTFLISLDGRIDRVEGILCVAGIIIYTLFLIRHSRKAGQGVGNHQEASGNQPRTSATVLYIVGGLGLLVLGASWLVESAVTIAQLLGVSELIIGLTIVAAGTSLPEVATSIVATIRGERDIAVGNIVGSNIFNILMVLGLSGVIAPDGIHVSPAALHFDIPIMIAVAVACLPIFFTGQVIARWEGVVFLGYYIAYTLYLVLAAAEHAALAIFSAAMAWFVIPLTVLTLLLVTLRALRSSPQETIP